MFTIQNNSNGENRFVTFGGQSIPSSNSLDGEHRTVPVRISSDALSYIIDSEKNNKGASFTIRSKETGKDFTYKVSRSEFNGRWYTHVKVEEGYLNFVRLGHFWNGSLWMQKKMVKTPAATAIAWVLQKATEKKFDLLNKTVDIFHLGSCIKCGRTLTDSTSILLGIGPVCRSIKA